MRNRGERDTAEAESGSFLTYHGQSPYWRHPPHSTGLPLGQGQGRAPSLQSSPCPWLGPLPLLASEQPSQPSPSQGWLSHLQLLEA